MAFRRAGFSPAEVKRLCEGIVLSQVADVLRGTAHVEHNTNIIDCDAAPQLPGKLKLVEHIPNGKWKWDSRQITLLPMAQVVTSSSTSASIRDTLERFVPLNINVLNHLLRYPHLIPEAWKQIGDEMRYIFFCGTRFQGYAYDDFPCTPYLMWRHDRWELQIYEESKILNAKSWHRQCFIAVVTK
jgi:hypothetical protein